MQSVRIECYWFSFHLTISCTSRSQNITGSIIIPLISGFKKTGRSVILGALAKAVRKVTFGLEYILSPVLRTEDLGCHLENFCDMSYWGLLIKLVDTS
jgi:hypothetical protein